MVMIEDLGRVYPTIHSKQKKHYGIFQCPNCNKLVRTCVDNVKKGLSKQCKTCAGYGKATTHGLRKHPLYSVYTNMKTRCYNKNNNAYKNYGAIGVTICDEWLNDFMSFFIWAISNNWNENLEIDKDILCEKLNIYPKIYSPETCIFITKSENAKERNERYRNAK